MQEIVLLLTGVAGAASAVAYRRLPGRGALRRGGRGRRAGGQGGADAAGRIRSRIGALAAERDILGKAISRVHEDAALNGRQKDALLAMYQRQLAAVLAKIDRLEEASRYPDLGPVGDGLAELMDQKLSSLDERLHELSARIAAAVPAAAAEAEEAAQGSRARRPGKKAGMQERAAVGSSGADAAAANGAAEVVGAPRQEGGAAAAQQSTLDMPRQEQQLQEQPATLRQAQQQQQQRQPEAKAPHAKPASPGMRQGVKPVEITTLTTIGGGTGERKFPEVGRPAGAGPARAQSPPSPSPSPSPPSQSPPSPPSQSQSQSQSPPSPQPPRPSPQPQAGAAQRPGQATKPGAGAGTAVTAGVPAAATTAAAASVAAGAGPQHAASSSLPERLPKPRPFSVPDAEEQDLAADDPADDDLAAIVADIRSTLSKLEQAEVE